MARRRFEYVFDDESERSRITFDFSDQDSERFCVSVDGNEAVVYANRAGFMALAKLCISSPWVRIGLDFTSTCAKTSAAMLLSPINCVSC